MHHESCATCQRTGGLEMSPEFDELGMQAWEGGGVGGGGEGIPLTLHSLTESESISNVYKCTSRDDLSGFLPASPRVLVLDP